eukprot:5538196-Prymnesium_polylepis.1
MAVRALAELVGTSCALVSFWHTGGRGFHSSVDSTLYRRAVTGHSPSSSPGFRHTRRQRSAAWDSRGPAHGHGDTTHGSSYPPRHHNAPGPVRAATP